MKSKKVTFLRGRRIRATRIDAAGRPVYGDGNAVVSKGVITLGYTTNTEEGEAVIVPNFAGENCVVDPAVPTFNGHTVEAEFCEVDFALFSLMTGQEVVLDHTGQIVGLTESTDVDLSAVNFALELWIGANSDVAASTGSQGNFGYVLTPNLGGGVIGDVSVENGAITFTVTGMATRNGTGWGAGPYAVELDGSGEATVLSTPLKLNDHRRIMTVEVAPPAIYSGSVPVLDPTDVPLTDITLIATALSVNIDPVPAGTEPIWYDFGDGEWDYAETGAYTHVYATAGTYTVTARRGLSTVTKNVTVTA